LGQAQQKAGLSKVQALSQLSILFVLQVRRPLRLGLSQGGSGAFQQGVMDFIHRIGIERGVKLSA
jgi:hypothetical protein